MHFETRNVWNEDKTRQFCGGVMSYSLILKM